MAHFVVGWADTEGPIEVQPQIFRSLQTAKSAADRVAHSLEMTDLVGQGVVFELTYRYGHVAGDDQ